MTLLCGLLGLPPVNGVLPQSPMHTKALAQVVGPPGKRAKKQARAAAAVAAAAAAAAAAEAPEAQPPPMAAPHAVAQLPGTTAASPGTPAAAAAAAAAAAFGQPRYSSDMVRGYSEGSSPTASVALAASLHPSPSKQTLLRGVQRSGDGAATPVAAANGALGRSASQALYDADAGSGGGGGGGGGGGEGDAMVVVRVVEQRFSGLLQSLGIGACLAAMPAIRQIPTAVLWGEPGWWWGGMRGGWAAGGGAARHMCSRPSSG